MPMTSQTNSRIHRYVFQTGHQPKEIKIPMIGTNGTHGVLNGRRSSGRLNSQNPHASTNNHKRQQRADADQLPQVADGHQRPHESNAEFQQ